MPDWVKVWPGFSARTGPSQDFFTWALINFQELKESWVKILVRARLFLHGP